jgi:acetyltransferase-like isoleucine patch superfamily enzyme
MENIFFDINQLKSCGKNVIIGKTVRIRYPELVEIGDNVIIDDFIYISTNLKIGNYVHISSGCHIIGGSSSFVEFRDFSTLAPGVVLAAGSGDYVSGIATVCVPPIDRGFIEYGKIIIGKHSVIGANSVILPNVTVGDGAALGALSVAKSDLEEWWLYSGIAAKKKKKRNKEKIESLERDFLLKLDL